MGRSLLVVLALVTALVAVPQPAHGASVGHKVAIIVGPVGAKLTPVYIQIAEAAARRAESDGATVARAYSPRADPEHVLAAVKDADIVVYLGHGVGVPNPYSDRPNPEKVNGWALQGPKARGDHSDSWQDGTLQYYGEAWLARHAHPAPGWVMIYSNACYAAGAGEQDQPAATPAQAVSRLASYSRTPLTGMGASAVFATDFYESAAQLIDAILRHPQLTFGQIYAAETRYQRSAVTALPHPFAAGRELLLQRSAYFDGRVDYWYSFAGSPDARPFGPAGSRVAAGPPPSPSAKPVVFGSAIPASGVVRGMASSYSAQPGWGSQPTVALPVAYGGKLAHADADRITVCADHCVMLPVVDSCPCYYGTSDARVANLSLSAWQLVSDAPIAEGLVPVTLYLRAQPPQDGPPRLHPPTAARY